MHPVLDRQSVRTCRTSFHFDAGTVARAAPHYRGSGVRRPPQPLVRKSGLKMGSTRVFASSWSSIRAD